VRGLAANGAYAIRDIFRLSGAGESASLAEARLVWTGEPVSYAEEIQLKGLVERVQLTRDVFSGRTDSKGEVDETQGAEQPFSTAGRVA
jgi:hypothetical protein